MPVISPGTDGINQFGSVRGVVPVAAILPVLLAGAYDTGTLEEPLLYRNPRVHNQLEAGTSLPFVWPLQPT